MHSTPQREAHTPDARSGALDCLRVLGIIAVIAGHVWSTDTTDKVIYPWHVPLFFVLTGYFWKPGRPFYAEARKRYRTLARPYLFWLATILALWVAVNIAINDLTVSDILAPIYGGAHALRPFSAFWFVTVLFFAALAYRGLEKASDVVRWAVIFGGLLAAVWIGEALAQTPLSVGSAWPCLVFLAAGTVLRTYEPRVSAPFFVGVILLTCSAVLVAIGWSKPLDIKQGDYGTPVVSVLVAVATCAGLVFVIKRIFAHCKSWVHKLSTTLAQAGFVVILTHAVPLLLLRTPQVGSITDFLAAMVIPWVFGLIFLKTRLASWMTGVDQSEKAGLVSRTT